jgi:hypothetical protein
MKEIFNNILKSFNNKEEGYSSRKLTAFVIIVLVIITHIKWLALGDFTHLEMVLTIDYSFIAALFGMTTYSAIKSKKEKPIDEIKKEAEAS